MPTPFETRKAFHKDIIKEKKNYEKEFSLYKNIDQEIKNKNEEIQRIKKALEESEAKFGVTSPEHNRLLSTKIPKKTLLESEVLKLENDRQNKRNLSESYKRDKIKIQEQRNTEEKSDGVPKYTENIPLVNKAGRFFDYPIDWANKMIRKFKEDVSTSTQKKALAAALGLIGYGVYNQNQDKINNYVEDTIKNTKTENVIKENVNNSKEKMSDSINIKEAKEKKELKNFIYMGGKKLILYENGDLKEEKNYDYFDLEQVFQNGIKGALNQSNSLKKPGLFLKKEIGIDGKYELNVYYKDSGEKYYGENPFY